MEKKVEQGKSIGSAKLGMKVIVLYSMGHSRRHLNKTWGVRAKHAISRGRKFQADGSARGNSLRQTYTKVFLEIDKDASVVTAELTRGNKEGSEDGELDHGGHFREM